MSRKWCFRNEGRTLGPFSTPEIKNLAAAGLLQPRALIWLEDDGPSQAVRASTKVDFSSLQGVALPAPDWLDDFEQENGPGSIEFSAPAVSEPPENPSHAEEAGPVSAAPPIPTMPDTAIGDVQGLPQPVGPFPRTSSVLECGFRLGKYQVLTHIATGGMGAVYKAMDLELGRAVALKVLRARLAGSSLALERFRREARNSARLVHPNIVTLFECGHDAEKDLHYLAFEFIDGLNLDRLIERRGQLQPAEAHRILIKVTRALDHAFEQGIVHRDIKPSNIMLARKGNKATVKLTDLGLSRLQDDRDLKVTRLGTTVGTIDYMSPEQASDSRAADIRSDIYSLGCTAFHMLAGKAPYADCSLVQRVLRQLQEPPPDVRPHNPAVSAGFAAILTRMLAKDPTDRYATPADLLIDLKRTPSCVADTDFGTRSEVDLPSSANLPPPDELAPAPKAMDTHVSDESQSSGDTGANAESA